MEKTINPWREKFGNRDAVHGGIEPADLDRIFGDRREAEIPRIPQRLVEYAAAEPERFEECEPPPGRKLAKEIIRQTLKLFPRVLYSDVIGKSRFRFIVQARWSCIRAVRRECPHLPLAQIGRIFNRDHTTIINALSSKSRRQKQIRHRERTLRLKAAQ